MSNHAPYSFPATAISINRAARILQPAAGGFDDAKERIWNAMREQRLSVYCSRPSPPHPVETWSQAKARADWFTPTNERELCRGTQRTTESVEAWGQFLYDGGLLVDREEIEALDGPGAWLRATAASLVEEVRLRRTNWNLPQALGWVATREHEQVAQIACAGAWLPPADDERAYLNRIYQTGREQSSIGWLIRRVSLDHCKSGAQSDEHHEAWQSCSCTIGAFNELFDAIQKGKIAAYDESIRAPIDVAQLPDFSLDPYGFTLAAPRHPGAVTFRRVDLERLWPQRRRQAGRKPKYEWPAFISAAKDLILDEGGFHEGWRLADCERAMTNWCEFNWSKVPGESSIREHVVKAKAEYDLDKAENRLRA